MAETPREPDRFDAQARELMDSECPHERDDYDEIPCVLCLAGFLRAEHASALERAAQEADALGMIGVPMGGPYALALVARKIRALIPPAAAPAAVPDCPHCGSSRSRVQEAGAAPPEFRECIGCGVLWQDPARREPPAPAAETGKAPEPEQCDRDVFEYGATVAVLAIGKQQAESLCAGLRVVTGWKWDWFYAAGREVIRCLCPPAPAPAQGAEAHEDRDLAEDWQDRCETAQARIAELEGSLRGAYRQNAKPPGDWACAECRPGSDIVAKGFRCWWHVGESLARAAPPEGEGK